MYLPITLVVVASCAADALGPVRHRMEFIGRVSFVFEGEYQRLDGEGDKDFSEYPLSGTVEIDFRGSIVRWTERTPTRAGMAFADTSVTKQKTRSVKRDVGNEVGTQTLGPGGLSGTRSYGGEPVGNWFPMAALAVATDRDAGMFSHEGEEKVEGRNQQVFRLKQGTDETKFWVDLERNALVTATEFSRKGVRLERMTVVNSSEFTRADGSKVWLPTVIAKEMVAKRPVRGRPWVTTKEPWARWTYRMVTRTLKLDDSPSVEVEFKRSVPTTDELNPPPPPAVKATFGALDPPVAKNVKTPVTIKEAQRSITEADIQKAQLQATLRPPPVDWTQRIAWGLVIVGALGAAFAWYRGMRAA